LACFSCLRIITSESSQVSDNAGYGTIPNHAYCLRNYFAIVQPNFTPPEG
jgi:hypothetical protein